MTSPENSECSMRDAEACVMLPAEECTPCLASKHRKTNDLPPLDVIVFQRQIFPESDSDIFNSNFRQSPLCSSVKSTQSQSGMELSTSLFRLMPRNTMKTTPSPSSQGRKRSSASISLGIFSHNGCTNTVKDAQASTSSRTKTEAVFGSSVILQAPSDHGHHSESPGGMSGTLSTLNALTLRTPQKVHPCCINPKTMGPTLQRDCLQDTLEQRDCLAKSSFSRSNVCSAFERSPSTLPESSTYMHTPNRMASPAGSALSSPKLAPLAVLSHEGRIYPNAKAIRKPVQTYFDENCDEDNDRVLQITRWRASNESNDSFSTINRNDGHDSSYSSVRKSIADRIPLPQLTFTPRSCGTQGTSMPSLPSPPSRGGMNSFFLALGNETRSFLQDKKTRHGRNVHTENTPRFLSQDTVYSSLDEEDCVIPSASLPNLFDVSLKKETKYFLHGPTKCQQQSRFQVGQRCRSLLTRSESEDSINVGMCFDPLDDENESLNFSDDECKFFLVAPSSVQTERYKQNFPHKKMRVHQSSTTSTLEPLLDMEYS